MDYILKTNQLRKQYGKNVVLTDLNMSIPKGAIYGFVGKNGAGKTTLIRQICGLQKPTSGTYELFGISYKSKDIIKSRKRMGAIVEGPALYKGMSAADNLRQQYLNIGLPNYDDIDKLIELVGLKDAGGKKVKNYSLGMCQRLAIAVALCGNPDFLVLDEPINGLDPQGIIEIRELILKLNREKEITILISSHILEELAKIATHYGFIDKGHIVRQMSARELENECRKSLRIEISNASVLSQIMELRGIEYKLLDDKTADIFGQIKISDLAVELANAGCEVISMHEHDESIEAFYLSLLGGNKHE